MLKYLILFLIASVFSFLLTPLLRSFAIKVGAMDIPGERKVHEQPTPRLGGLSIFISFNLILLIASQIGFFHFPKNFLREMRVWGKVGEFGEKYLRVVTLEDGITIHNAFIDRGFKTKGRGNL
jgi:UDP-N-acetylmuramyl pentapeptide phosphotransferase/UDP-N-acetylglucosamine-1-phosphate transferase